jgi:protein-S-isoprenylcysteine O-methyltransferase Ste14
MIDAQAMFDALIVALAVAAYGALHSLFASLTVKAWIRQCLGPQADRFYRLTYNCVALLSLLPIPALLIWRPGVVLYRLDSPWGAMAVIGQLLSAALLCIGFLQTDAWSFLGLRQLRGLPQTPPRFVATGLYRWVRHPLYTAGLFLIWLTPVMTSSVLALNLVLTLYVLAGSRLEERRLVAEFGADYRDYQRRVPALIPVRWPSRH